MSDTSTSPATDESTGNNSTGSERQRIAVLGAGGSAGAAVLTACLAAGHEVIAVSRTGAAPADQLPDAPRGLTRRRADLTDVSATTAAVAGADVVVMAANIPYPRWASELAALVDGAADAAAAVGARFVMVDNLYMYSPPVGPLNERSPEHATDPKGVLRRRIGERLLERHRSGELAVAIARVSDFYGPGATSSGLYVTGIRPGVNGKRMRALFELDQPHAFAYLPDVGRAIVELIEHPDADGRVWVLPATVTATQREMFGAVNELLPKKVKVGTATSTMLRLGGLFSPMLRELRSVEPQFARPWIVDSGDFDERFGFRTTDPDEALAATVESFRITGTG